MVDLTEEERAAITATMKRMALLMDEKKGRLEGRIKVVVLGPGVRDAPAQDSETTGADAYLLKPFSPLPVLGVPGWWPDNAKLGFYDDAEVFRPRRDRG